MPFKQKENWPVKSSSRVPDKKVENWVKELSKQKDILDGIILEETKKCNMLKASLKEQTAKEDTLAKKQAELTVKLANIFILSLWSEVQGYDEVDYYWWIDEVKDIREDIKFEEFKAEWQSHKLDKHVDAFKMSKKALSDAVKRGEKLSKEISKA